LRQWQPLLTDPFADPGLFIEAHRSSDQQIREFHKLYQERVDHADQVFKSTRDDMKSYLESIRTTDNSEQIEELIKRVKAVQFSPMNLDLDMVSFCGKPNARLKTATHSILVCPQFLAMPEATLRTLFLHELGHSIDPCIAEAPLYSRPRVPVARPEGDQTPNYYPTTNYDGLEYGTAAGRGGQLAAKGIKPNQHPFAKAIGCLSGESSVGARTNGRQEGIKRVRDEILLLENEGASAANSRKLSATKEYLRQLEASEYGNASCSDYKGRDGYNQIQDGFSDWIAAEVIGQKAAALSDKPDVQRRFVSESLGLVAQMTCIQIRSGLGLYVSDIRQQYKCEERGMSISVQDFVESQLDDRNTGDHSESVDRTNKIFLANPGISAALDCKPPAGVTHCAAK
jgi:hypothetical protein